MHVMKKRIRDIKSYSKDFGPDEYRILFFKSPADVKNTAFLTYDYDDPNKDDDQWLYLPALKKVKRIPSIGIVRKDNYVVVRSIGFMKHGKKKYLDIRKLHKQNGIWVPDEMTMTTKKGKLTLHKTILKFSHIKVNKPLSDDLFTTRRLEKGI